MSTNILKILNKNSKSILSYSNKLVQITDNTTNETIDHVVDITVEDPQNMNSRSVIDDNIAIEPSIDLYDNLHIIPETNNNDTTSFYLNESYLNKLQQDFNYLKTTEHKHQIDISKIINNDIVLLNLDIQSNQITLMRDMVNRKGILKLLDKDNFIHYTNDKIISLLYNSDILNYFLNNINNESFGNETINKSMLKCGNEIPVKILNNITIKTLNEYYLNTFIIDIPVTLNNNIFNSILTVKEIQSAGVVYNLKFKIFFDIEQVDKFPINFLQQPNQVNSMTNTELLKYVQTFNIEIQDNRVGVNFLQECLDGKYKQFYLIFN